MHRKDRESFEERLERRAANWRRRPEPTDDYVYFLRCGDFVKIGRSRDPKKRLANLSTMVPYQCELLLVISGPPSLEGAMHRYFHDCRERYEWFALNEKMTIFIAKQKERCLAARFLVPGADVRTRAGTLRSMADKQRFKKTTTKQQVTME